MFGYSLTMSPKASPVRSLVLRLVWKRRGASLRSGGLLEVTGGPALRRHWYLSCKLSYMLVTSENQNKLLDVSPTLETLSPVSPCDLSLLHMFPPWCDIARGCFHILWICSFHDCEINKSFKIFSKKHVKWKLSENFNWKAGEMTA